MCPSLHPEFFPSHDPLAWSLSLLSHACVSFCSGYLEGMAVGGRETLLSDLCVQLSPLFNQGVFMGLCFSEQFQPYILLLGCRGGGFSHKVSPMFLDCL